MALRKKTMIILGTILATLIITVLVLNFSLGDKQIDRRLQHQYTTADEQFLRSMGVLLGPALVSGNQVRTLLNGDEIFPAMLSAIRAAQHTITFETFIYWSGSIGKEFADALTERAQNGVKVHVLLDWVGSDKMEQVMLDEMEHAGVTIKRYNKPRWYNIGRLNTHRKLLVVDGKIGFTGGGGHRRSLAW